MKSAGWLTAKGLSKIYYRSTNLNHKPPKVKIAKDQIISRKRSLPFVKFADQDLTSFGGLIIFQSYFQKIGLSSSLTNICSSLDLKITRQHSYGTILFCIILHLLLGFRKLRDSDFYRDDPMVKNTLKLKTLPSVPTISRMLTDFDEPTIDLIHQFNNDLVIERLRNTNLKRVTIDLDGSVQSTTRHAESTAVGFNKKKKGQRSYYPLFATIAQTTQILNFLHRSGNVHDSNGSIEFLKKCIAIVRKALPKAIIEVRMDSAFFNQHMIDTLDQLKVEYTISVPFERLPELKHMIESRKRWRGAKNGKGKKIGYFEKSWKPKSWSQKQRFLFIRTPAKKQRKGPLQLDLFEPVDSENKYKVVVTNKKARASHVVSFHEGRGTQEKIFGEAKSQLSMDYIPCRKKVANEVFLLCSVIAHNLGRELQMNSTKPERKTTPQRQPLWVFEEISSIRNKIIRTAGRLTRPKGLLTLTMAKSPAREREIGQYLEAAA